MADLASPEQTRPSANPEGPAHAAQLPQGHGEGQLMDKVVSFPYSCHPTSPHHHSQSQARSGNGHYPLPPISHL